MLDRHVCLVRVTGFREVIGYRLVNAGDFAPFDGDSDQEGDDALGNRVDLVKLMGRLIVPRVREQRSPVLNDLAMVDFMLG